MNKMFPMLFSSGKIGQVELENRIVKVATRLALQSTAQALTDRMISFYEEQARGGASLLIVNAAGASMGGPEYIPELTFLAKVIQDNGSKAALQVSGHAASNKSLNEITVEEIQGIINACGDAALRGKNAGFDMIELHPGHGGLVYSFMSRATNKRMDQYGGSIENRMRIQLEIVENIRKKIGPDYPLIVRLSAIDYIPDGVVLEDSIALAKELEQRGVDALDVDGGSHVTPESSLYLAPPMVMPVAYHVPAAVAVKEVVSIPVIVAGAVNTPEMAEEILGHGQADFIGMARALFADPYWPRKAREGRPEDIVPCIRCNYGCHDVGPPDFSIRCTTNTALGWENRLPITPTDSVKNVAVIGGGPGGMEAARVLALRGHNVTLYEKRELGGALIEASVPEFKSEIRRLIRYYSTQMEKLKIKIVQEEATFEGIRDIGFDAVIVAVGAALRKPDILGVDGPNVSDVLAVLDGKVHIGQRVHVVGGGIIAAEVGLYLAEQGKEVIFTTRQDRLMTDIGQPRPAYEERLARQKTTTYTGRWPDKITEKGGVVRDKDGNLQEIVADNVVLASGFLPEIGLKERLEKETALDVYAVGDCISPRLIYHAIHEGFAVGRKV